MLGWALWLAVPCQRRTPVSCMSIVPHTVMAGLQCALYASNELEATRLLAWL